MNKKVLNLALRMENQRFSDVVIKVSHLQREKSGIQTKQGDLRYAADKLLSVYRELSNSDIQIDSVQLREKTKWASRALTLKLHSEVKIKSLDTEIDLVEYAISNNKILIKKSEVKLTEQKQKIREINYKDLLIRANTEQEDMLEVKYNV